MYFASALTEEEKALQQKYQLLRGIKATINNKPKEVVPEPVEELENKPKAAGAGAEKVSKPDSDDVNKNNFDSKKIATGGNTPDRATELAKELVRSGKVTIQRQEPKEVFKKAKIHPTARQQNDDGKGLRSTSGSPSSTRTNFLQPYPVSPTSVVFRRPSTAVKRPSNYSGDYYDFKRRPIISYDDCDDVDDDDD